MMEFKIDIRGLSQGCFIDGKRRVYGYSLMVNDTEVYWYGKGFGVFSFRVFGYGFMFKGMRVSLLKRND